MNDPYLIAYCTNAVSYDRAEIAFAIAYKDEDGDWMDSNGQTYTPFWVEPFEAPELTIPNGWIEHLHRLAEHYAANHRTPKLNIAALMPQAPPIRRRV